MSDAFAGWEVIAQAAELARRGEDCALATVVWRQGPSSGQQGSRAIVTAAGAIHGWIGGACAEPTVIREAQAAITDGEPRLLLLGTPEQFGHVPDGMRVIPISCQSEGAMEVYIEPVVSTPHLVVVGRSPMSHMLRDLAQVLGWRADLVDGADFSPEAVDAAVGRRDRHARARRRGRHRARRHRVAGVSWGSSHHGGAVSRCSPTSPSVECRSTCSIECGCRWGSISATRRTPRSPSRSSPSSCSCGRRARSRRIEMPHRRRCPTTAIDPVCGMTVTHRTIEPARSSTRASPTTSARRLPSGVRARALPAYLDKEARC